MSKYRVGQFIKIVRVDGKVWSGTPLGTWKVTSTVPYNVYAGIVSANNTTYYFYDHEVEPCAETKKEILDVIAEKEAEIAVQRGKLDWMEEVGEDEYSEEEFKIYQALSIIESSKDKKAKVKALRDLLEG